MKKINNLRIYGRKWFQKSCGNTYHSVRVIVNDEELYIGCAYGYGNHYIQTALDLLIENGFDVPTEYGKFLTFMSKNNFEYSAVDVDRKKDL